MKQLLILVCSLIQIVLLANGHITDNSEQQAEMKVMDTKSQTPIEITVGNKIFQAVLYDNPTSQSLINQMPFTAKIEDYAGIEKIFYPAISLNTQDAPSGAHPDHGDIMYYAPWGDVAIFYKEFRYAEGLIPLGRIEDIDGFIEAIAKENTVRFTVK